MHTTTRDIVADAEAAEKLGVPVATNILTNTLEGDGPVALCSPAAQLSAKVISVARTESGGIVIQTALFISEPANIPVPVPAIAEDPKFLEAVEYFVGKGLTDTDARKKVNEFGVVRVLAAKDRELDTQLDTLVSKSEPPAAE